MIGIEKNSHDTVMAGSPYAITITFKEGLERFRPRQQLRRVLDHFAYLKRCTQFELYPELTIQGRLHLHGIIYLTDKIKWYKQVLPILMRSGYVKIKRIDNMDKWIKYCRKDIDNMSQILSFGLPLTADTYHLLAPPAKQPKRYKLSDIPSILEKLGVEDVNVIEVEMDFDNEKVEMLKD